MFEQHKMLATKATFARVVEQAIAFAVTSMFIGINASAQSNIDPSSALLLGSDTMKRTNERGSSDARLESGRYTVKPRERNVETTKPQGTSALPNPSPTPVSTVKRPTENVTVVEHPANSQGKVVITESPAPADTDAATETVNTESEPSDIENLYRLLEINAGSAYFYENADSGFSYRRGIMTGPAYQVGAKVWFTPEFAVTVRHFSSLGGTVSDSGSTRSASRTESHLGVNLRRSYMLGGRRSNLILGIEYIDSQYRISGDTVTRVGTKSNGIQISVAGEFENSSTRSTVIGFSLAPKQSHEESAAATSVQSGSSVDSYRLGATIERRWKFDSSSAFFLKLEHAVERNLFSGPATGPDIETGVAPNGVGATIGTTVIQFGYSWGG